MPEGDGPDAVSSPPSELSWRVSTGLCALRMVGAALFGGVALLTAGDPVRATLAGMAALVLAGYALRDVLVPVRLRADAEGLTVARGFAGQQRLAWSEVDRVRVDRRKRLTGRSELLEIDDGESLRLLSTYDLGAPCPDVLTALRSVAPDPHPFRA